MDVTYVGALVAGLLSFLSPCVLPLVPPYLCFLGGALCSILAGYFGMQVATKANVRAAAAAQHGISPALRIAFSGGSVMGMCVVSLGMLGLGSFYLLFNQNVDYITGFSLGASR